MRNGSYPNDLRVYLTFKCNRSCSHCYTESSPDSCDCAVDVGKVINLIEYLASRKLRQVVLDGGEPMLRADSVAELLEYCGRSNLRTILRTNGDFLDNGQVLSIMHKQPNCFLELSSVHVFNGKRLETAKVLTALGDLAKRTTLIIYEQYGGNLSKEEMKEATAGFKEVRRSYVCRFGRAQHFPIRYEMLPLREIPACESVGKSVVLYPDGTLWACGGYLIFQLWKDRNFGTPLYWGNINSESVEACIEGRSQNLLLRIIGTVGHWGLLRMISETGSPAQSGSIANSDLECEHICKACQKILASYHDFPESLAKQAVGYIEDDLEEAIELKDGLFPLAVAE